MSVLIWVQTVCKGYQQMTKVAGSKERSVSSFVPFSFLRQFSAATGWIVQKYGKMRHGY